MQVEIRYFAVFRDAVGLERETVTTEACDTGALFREAMGRHAGLAHEPAALVAVNDELVGWDAAIGDGDQVLFFPPVAGG